jgi:hypothetical protein
MFDSMDGEEAMLMDGFDDCIVGVGRQQFRGPFFIYDAEKVIQKLMDCDGMTRQEAEEFHEFKQVGAWVGDGAPVMMDVLNDE